MPQTKNKGICGKEKIEKRKIAGVKTQRERESEGERERDGERRYNKNK